MSEAPLRPDRLLDVALPGRDARFVLIDASSTAFEAEFRHLAGRIAAETTARAAVGALLLGSDLKGDERLSIQARGLGPLEGLLVEVDAELRFRGYTHKKVLRDADLSEASFKTGLGAEGRLQFIRSTGSQIVYRGVTTLRTGDPADDFRGAMEDSAQIPTRLWIDHGYSRQLTHATGVMLQALPGHDRTSFDALGDAIGARLAGAPKGLRDLPALVDAALPHGVERRVLSERPVAFACRCSREKVVAMLRSVGPPEGEAAHPPESRVTCVFCNDLFAIDASELA